VAYGNQKDAKPNLDRNRYHALNLTNLASGSKHTVEFRVFSGSLSATKIAGWIQVALGLVERAVAGKRMPKWNPGPLKGGWKKAGEGQSETERLMGYLAWGAGWAKLHNGRQYGWISNAIPQDAIKNEFRRLAAKYDAMAYGREVPIEIRVVRPATSDEIEMVRFHERMLANERRRQQRPAPVLISDRIRLVAIAERSGSAAGRRTGPYHRLPAQRRRRGLVPDRRRLGQRPLADARVAARRVRGGGRQLTAKPEARGTRRADRFRRCVQSRLYGLLLP
jgi:hypothetical protein